MPTFVYMTRCDGCGHCVDVCPSDIMHIDKTYRRAYNIEPNMCWECYSCVKACPQHAIDVRGYADFAPLGHSVRVLPGGGEGNHLLEAQVPGRAREELRFSDQDHTLGIDSSHRPTTMAPPSPDALKAQELAHEPEALHIPKRCPRWLQKKLQERVGSNGSVHIRRKTVFVDSDILVVGGGFGRLRGHLRIQILGA